MNCILLALGLIGASLCGASFLLWQRSQLKLQRRLLMEEREKYRALISNLPASVIICSITNEIILCSPYTEVLTGYSVEEIKNIPENIFIFSALEEDKERIRKSLQFSLYAGEPYSTSFRYVHRSGIPMNGELRITPLFDTRGDIQSTLAIVVDTTAAANYRDELETAHRDLREFSYLLSHDLKAPLVTIQGMANLIQSEFSQEATGELKEAVSHISNAAGRLQELIDKILSYAQLGRTVQSVEKVNLEVILGEITEDLAQLIKESGAKVEISPTEVGQLENSENFCVESDRAWIYQIFSNLITNAIKYSSTDRAPLIDIHLSRIQGDQKIQVAIKDNGRGMSQDELKTVFKPFARFAHDVSGNGLGLASVKKLVEQLKGSIYVESTPDVGSTFTVVLNRSCSTKESHLRGQRI